VLVAIAILAGAVGTLAQLAVVAAHANASARIATFSALLAAQKMEQLRALTWGIDASGQSISDLSTDVTVTPPAAHNGIGLTPSPGDALQRDTPGYCDFLDANGRWLAGGAPPSGAIYARRWSIDPLPSSPDDTLVLQVLVVRRRTNSTVFKRPDEARLTTVRTRTSW
jgi:hypothetical protein